MIILLQYAFVILAYILAFYTLDFSAFCSDVRVSTCMRCDTPIYHNTKVTHLESLLGVQAGLPLAPKRVLTPTNTLLTLPTLRSNALAALASQRQDVGHASQQLLHCHGLRLEAWLASCTGREHARMGQVHFQPIWLGLCLDVAHELNI